MMRMRTWSGSLERGNEEGGGGLGRLPRVGDAMSFRCGGRCGLWIAWVREKTRGTERTMGVI